MDDRILGRARGTSHGPTLIVVGGIHGNEPAGAKAAENVLRAAADLPLAGEAVAFAGNLGALRANRRFLDRDLNRQWTAERISLLESATDVEAEEQRELLSAIETALAEARGPAYFVDLHTTSAGGIPFVVSGESLEQRTFAAQLLLPVIVGLQESVRGSIGHYLSSRCVSISVEGGQHTSGETVANLEAVLWAALAAAGVARSEDLTSLPQARTRLERSRGGLPLLIEVLSRHAITPADEFRMEPGFTNIHRAQAGVLIARDRRGEIRATEDGLVLLPLYQSEGEDGFFFGREVILAQ